MREHDPLLLGLQQGFFLRVWLSVTTWNSRNPSESHQNDADITLDARLPEQTRSQATRLQLLWIQKWGQIFRLVYSLYQFRFVYCIFVIICLCLCICFIWISINVWGRCLFLSLPFDPDLNESWFKLWHVKTNLKDALGTGNRAASRRSGFKKSQIVKTSWSKFFVQA